MAFEAPSGLVGKPASTDDFDAYFIEDITIYIAKDVLKNNLKKNLLYIYIEGYGRFLVEILD